MTILILNSVIFALVIVALFILYYQSRIYREQKELIEKESQALKTLRHKNLEALKTRFLLRRVKV